MGCRSNAKLVGQLSETCELPVRHQVQGFLFLLPLKAVLPKLATRTDTAMKPEIVSVLDDETIKDELERMKERHPDYEFDTSFTFDKSFAFDNTDSEYVINFNPDETETWSPEPLPEVEAMRVACRGI